MLPGTAAVDVENTILLVRAEREPWFHPRTECRPFLSDRHIQPVECDKPAACDTQQAKPAEPTIEATDGSFHDVCFLLIGFKLRF